MKKKIARNLFSLILVFIFFHLVFATPILAHVLESDGSIGAVLHVDPADDPIVNQQSGFFLEFKDKTGKFKPENCECTFSILESGKEIFSQPLFQNNNLTSTSIFYTFTQKDIYEIRVVGKPNRAGLFQPFTLNYNLRVSREASAPNPQGVGVTNWLSTHVIHFIGGFIVLGFLIFALFKQRKTLP